MKEIKVRKGKHMALNQFTLPMYDTYSLIKRITFTDSCRYKLEDGDQKDWNKLFGKSFGFFPLLKQFQQHYNSARFGWRYSPGTDFIEAAPYWYDNGVRHHADTDRLPVANLLIGREYIFEIRCLSDLVLYSISDGNRIIQSWNIMQVTPSYSGFSAPLYFGGNQPAPQTIIILEGE